MALASDGYRLTIEMEDSFGKTSTKIVNLTSADFTAAASDASTYVTEFATKTLAEIVGYTVGEVFVENAPAGGAGNVGEKASITVNLATTGKRANFQIPAPDNLNISGTSDVDGSTIATLLGYYNSTGFATLSDGEQVADTGAFAGGRIVTVSRRPR
jgi:hypothetical protein